MANNVYGNVASSSTPAIVYASVGGSAGAPTTLAIAALSTNSAAVFIGFDSSVATSTGFPLAAGEKVTIDLMGQDVVYVVSAASQNVRYLTLHL